MELSDAKEEKEKGPSKRAVQALSAVSQIGTPGAMGPSAEDAQGRLRSRIEGSGATRTSGG
eukprot:2924147-Pyramimonas_sp.AAC.1